MNTPVALITGALAGIGCAWSDRHRDARSSDWHARQEGGLYDSVPLKRGAKPEEIADSIVFLASHHRADHQGQWRQNRHVITHSKLESSSSDIRRAPAAPTEKETHHD